MSAWMARARPPMEAISSAIFWASESPVEKLTATAYPRFPAKRAIAAPIPRLAPVTMRVPKSIAWAMLSVLLSSYHLAASVHQLDDGLVKTLAGLVALIGTRDISDAHFNACRGRQHINSWSCGNRLRSIAGRGLLPFGFSLAGIDGGFPLNQLLNAVDDRVGILRWRNQNLQFVPHPLAGRGEVEEMAFDGEAVYEGNTAAGRVAGVGPVAGFQQDGFEQADLDHFSADAIDLDPVSDANAIASHENEPAEECDDEIFHRDSKAGAGESQNGGRLRGHTKNNEQNEYDADCLCGKFNDGTKRVDAFVLSGNSSEQAFNKAVR